MRYLLLSIIIISLVGILMVPNAFAKEVTVQNVRGTSTSYDCEETNSCFNPNPVRININDKITWTNPDRAAHTVTSGNPIIGPDGYFDSSLIMAGGSYSFTFTSFGTYDYFCMVHPWMTGTIVVSEGTSSSTSSSSKTPTNLILDQPLITFNINTAHVGSDVTFSGKLETADKKFYLTHAPITLKFTGFTFQGKNHYEMTTDNEGKFNTVFTLPAGNFSIQAAFAGGTMSGEPVAPSKSQTEYFTVTSSSSSSSSSSQPTSNVGGPTFLKLEIETDKRDVSIKGKLTEKGKNSPARNVLITLIPSGFAFNSNTIANMGYCKTSELPNCVLTTDNFGNFKVMLTLPQSSIGKKYSIQAISAANNQWESSSLTQSFTITSSSQPSTQSSGVAGMEWIMILIPVIIIVGVVVAIKSRKKTPKATPQRKTFGVKQPKKRRTAGSPVGASSSTDGPSTYGYFECPNCHEPSAPQGKLGQNPDGSQFCSKCGWNSED